MSSCTPRLWRAIILYPPVLAQCRCRLVSGYYRQPRRHLSRPPFARPGGPPDDSMKRWHKLALWTGIGVVVLIAGAATWLWTADLGVFKPQIERLVSDA